MLSACYAKTIFPTSNKLLQRNERECWLNFAENEINYKKEMYLYHNLSS